MHGFLHEGLDRHIVIVNLSLLDKAGSRNFGDLDSKPQLILKVCELGMEANKFFPNDVVLFLYDFELFQLLLLFVKSWP